MASESPSTQRKNNRAPRQRQPQSASQPSSQQYAEVQSDSNLLATHTPKPKKHRQRQNDNKAMSGSEGPNPRTTAKPPRSAKQMPGARDSSAVQATPVKNLAYASAAFHQSPAASSLPMPKFLSKSVPAPASDNSMQARLDHDSDKASASPSPPSNATPDPAARMKSPLDMFFNADRQEKAKQQGMPCSNNAQISPFMPNRTPPATNKGLFMLELDNNTNSPAVQSARPSPAPRMSSAPGTVPAADQKDATAAATQSLKEFLNLTANQPTPQKQPMQQQPPSHPSPATSYLSSPFVTSTPQQQMRTDGYDSPLHYGNRNLSPLFQAARTPNGGPAPVNNNNNNNSPLQHRQPVNQQQPFDPRAFLDQQARSASATHNLNFSPIQSQRAHNGNHVSNPRFTPSGSNTTQAPHPSAAMPANYGPPPNSNGFVAQHQRYDSTADDAAVKDMEAKLRGILKLG